MNIEIRKSYKYRTYPTRAQITNLENQFSMCRHSRWPKPIQDENGKFLPNRSSIKAGLNKSINDAKWYQFLLYLEYKALELGKQIVSVAAHYTSQKCSACGRIMKKTLSVRIHRCCCGFVANRDHNAAINFLRVGLTTLAASAA